MGASGREFLKFRMEQHEYEKLNKEQQKGLELHKVDVQEVDYSHDELWCKLKSQSIKAYKKLKDREYDLRHNFKKNK